MINRIHCGAYGCTHNHRGSCGGGVIDVRFYAGPGYGEAYCDSYACPGSLRSSMHGMPAAGTPVDQAAREAGLDEQDTPVESDLISCTVTDCAHHTNGGCNAAYIDIRCPAPDGTLSACDMYTALH